MKKNIDNVPTSCYTQPEEVRRVSYDKNAVAKYHSRLKDMKIRFPKEDAENDIPDYSAIIKEQASKLGKSANEYILDLIQEDIRTNKAGIMDAEFTLKR